MKRTRETTDSSETKPCEEAGEDEEAEDTSATPPEKRQKAETEGTEQSTDKSVMEILIKNTTDVDLDSNDCCLCSQPLPDGSTRLWGVRLPARSVVDLTKDRGCTLVIRYPGLRLAGVEVEKDPSHQYFDKAHVVLEPVGTVFHVIKDPDNMPVTPDEVHKAHDIIVTCLEHCGRVPPTSAQDQSCWEWIATQLDRPADKCEGLKKQLRTTLARHRQSWDELYRRRRAVLPAGTPNAVRLKEAIDEGESVGIVVYFRALDRFPGGNADWGLFKFKMQFSTKQNECTVTWMAYRNWDGNGRMSREPAEWGKVETTKIKNLLIHPLMNLMTKERSVETTVLDEELDRLCIDTEWSSIEVLLYLPPALAREVGAAEEGVSATEHFTATTDGGADEQEQWPLVFRVHRRAVESREKMSELRPDLTIPTRVTLEGASFLLRVDRVKTYLSRARAVPSATALSDFVDIYLPPIFLHDN